MFYLETKDGEKFFTDSKSDDKLEFEKIVEAKMGAQAVQMLNELIEDARCEGEESVSLDNIDDMLNQIEAAISELKSKEPSIPEVISKLNQIKHMLYNI